MNTATLQRCLGDPTEFLRNHWSRKPLLQRGGSENGFEDLLSLDSVDEILTNRLVRYPDVRLIRAGEVLDVRSYCYLEKQDVGPGYLVPDLESVYEQFQRGATILLQGVHRYWAPLRALCREAESFFGYPVQCNAFVTPGAAQGLATHVDLYDSVVLHTHGTKDWTVFEPTVPMPIEGTGARLGTGEHGSLLLEASLRPGDSLYVPRGFPHAAATSASASVHATLLIFGRSWVEVLSDLIRTFAETEVGFREWIPPAAVGGNGLPHVAGAKVAELSAWLTSLDSEKVAAWIAERFAARSPELGAPSVGSLVALDRLTDSSLVGRGKDVSGALEEGEDGVVLGHADRRIEMPPWTAPGLRHILGRERFTIGELAPFFDDESRLVLVRRLVREGVLVSLDSGGP